MVWSPKTIKRAAKDHNHKKLVKKQKQHLKQIKSKKELRQIIIRRGLIMPVHVKKIGKKYRVVDPSGKIAKNKGGTALDGGGHSSSIKATKQAQAVNISLHKRGKI